MCDVHHSPVCFFKRFFFNLNIFFLFCVLFHCRRLFCVVIGNNWCEAKKIIVHHPHFMHENNVNARFFLSLSLCSYRHLLLSSLVCVHLLQIVGSRCTAHITQRWQMFNFSEYFFLFCLYECISVWYAGCWLVPPYLAHPTALHFNPFPIAASVTIGTFSVHKMADWTFCSWFNNVIYNQINILVSVQSVHRAAPNRLMR